jgi:hypothetical protein
MRNHIAEPFSEKRKAILAQLDYILPVSVCIDILQRSRCSTLSNYVFGEHNSDSRQTRQTCLKVSHDNLLNKQVDVRRCPTMSSENTTRIRDNDIMWQLLSHGPGRHRCTKPWIVGQGKVWWTGHRVWKCPMTIFTKNRKIILEYV